MVDMSAEAVTHRLREIERLLAERGLRRKGVDMTAEAVTERLRTLGSLSDMCLRLVEIGKPLRHR
ncbi:MAG TPA: hypothetical protein VGG33_21320 [Polyangia bacterium]